MALAFPAFAILLDIMVESDFPYANEAVPAVIVSFALLVAGGITALFFQTLSPVAKVAMASIDLGMVGTLVGIGLVGYRTWVAQERAAE